MLKLSDNPPMLSPEVASLTDLTGCWWVGHTKGRFEKAFAWDLHRRGIGYFLPLIERVRVSGGKKRRVLMPLFPSYVFFCGQKSDRYEAMATNRLCQTIDVVDRNGFVAELSAVEVALAGKVAMDPYPQVAVGHRCRIVGGALSGVEGVVVRYSKRSRVVLEVGMLGQGVIMEIDSDLIELID